MADRRDESQKPNRPEGEDQWQWRLKHDLNAALEEPQYASRRSQIVSRLKAEQQGSPVLLHSRKPPGERPGLFSPIRAGGLAAVLIAGIVLVFLFGQPNQKPTSVALAPPAIFTPSVNQPKEGINQAGASAKNTAPTAAAPAFARANTAASGSTSPSGSGSEPTKGGAVVTAGEVVGGNSPAPAAAAAGASAGGPKGSPARPQDFTALFAGLPVYPGSVPLNVPETALREFLTLNAVSLDSSKKQAVALQDTKKLIFGPQFSTKALDSQSGAGAFLEYYSSEAEKAGYKALPTYLREDQKLNALWLYLEKPGTRVGILIVEVKDLAEVNRLFGSGQFTEGETAVFFTRIP